MDTHPHPSSVTAPSASIIQALQKQATALRTCHSELNLKTSPFSASCSVLSYSFSTWTVHLVGEVCSEAEIPLRLKKCQGQTHMSE